MSTKHILVEDVMTRAVVSARADALFKEIAEAMVRNRISLVPVLGDGRQVLGVVSAADLLARVSGDHGEIPRGHRLAARHEQHRKVAAATAAQLMTAPAVTVAADTPLREAARRCARFHVRCMPVLDGSSKLVGIVSRSDLLKALSARRCRHPARDRTAHHSGPAAARSGATGGRGPGGRGEPGR